jgi:hypothetical protein
MLRSRSIAGVLPNCTRRGESPAPRSWEPRSLEDLPADAHLAEPDKSMMKRLILASVLAASISGGQPGLADDEPVMGNAPFIIPSADLPTIEKQALEGSPDAAQRLYRYYRKVALNSEAAVYWAQIAADNGDATGQYAFGLELLERKDEDSAVRAKYWIRRAAEQGNSRARDVLDRLEREQDR